MAAAFYTHLRSPRKLARQAGRLAVFAVAWVSGHVLVRAAEPVEAIGALKKMSVEDLMSLEVISVSKRPEKLADTASAIQVVTNEEIRRSGASTIPEALRLADNLDVVQKNSHDWGVSARGFNTELANKLLVMIDGRTVYTPLFSGVFWNVQDYLLEDIARIEAVSGPGGTLWGANAVNGVINIISKNARDTTGLYLEGGGGSRLTDFAALRYGGQLAPGIYYRVYGKYFNRDHELLANGAAATDGAARGQAGFRIDAETSPANSLTLQGDYYNGHDDLVAGGRARESGGNVLGRWTRTFSPESDLSLQVYFDRTHLFDPVPALVLSGTTFAPAGVLQDDLDTYDFDFQHRFRPGPRHEFIWGLGFRLTRDEVTNAPSLAFLPPQLEQKLYSGFVQDEIALAKNLSLTLGSKVEHNDYTGTEVEPSVRLQWNPAAGRMVWAAVSRAVRTPSRIDRDLSQAPPPRFVLLKGGPDFDSETVVAYELGYRMQPSAKTALTASAFYNDYDHVRSTSMTPTTVLPFFFANNLDAVTYGLELGGDFQLLDPWRLHAGYTLLKEDVRIKPGRADINNGLNEVSDPEHRFSLRSSLDLPHNVEFDAMWRWVDARPTHNGATPGTVAGFSELDIRIGWRPVPAFELSAIGQNLLHARHAEYGYPAPNRVEIQRRVYGKATWRF